jgi:hypothetical protein
MKGGHKSSNIKAHINFDINYYIKAANITAITTDNASDMKAATLTGFGQRFGFMAYII